MRSVFSPPPPPPPGPPPPPPQADGFASVNALGQNGTTGGAGGPTVTVDSAQSVPSIVPAGAGAGKL